MIDFANFERTQRKEDDKSGYDVGLETLIKILPGLQSESASQEEAVGGHDDSIRFEGRMVWKRDQGGRRGEAEMNFLRAAMEEPDLLGLVPALAGYRVKRGEQWLGMTNALSGLSQPAILDIKMGTQTWTPDAPAEKAASQAKKAAESSTGSLGVRVVGGKLLAANGEFTRVGYKNKQDVRNEQELQALLSSFLCSEQLRSSALAKVKAVQAWWAKQTEYAFYASSLLFAYDTKSNDECRIVMIDFANFERISTKADDQSGYDVGLDTLVRVISNLKS
ncbi:unnamed protein product [Polarella glacialis]|uniref:Kinase n=1 Tax=Polarella glacialis TaxID=89957 RepID=A0A813I124_POLGL|nr:unnamed protein product [Polarella glacialis]